MDICAGNALAVENTRLLREYCNADERVVKLCLLVKSWAKARGLNDAYRGTLSSYCYTLMCINFLQRRQPPILPCLQDAKWNSNPKRLVNGWDCSFAEIHYGMFPDPPNRESLGHLLYHFFLHFACVHDYSRDVLSVRTGGKINKRAKGWTTRVGRERHLVCVEDPLETSHDLGRNVDKHSLRVLRHEFSRAAVILESSSRPLDDLLLPAEEQRSQPDETRPREGSEE